MFDKDTKFTAVLDMLIRKLSPLLDDIRAAENERAANEELRQRALTKKIDENSTYEQYASAKAVVNYVNSKLTEGEYTTLVESADYTFEHTEIGGICMTSLNVVDVDKFKVGAVCKVTIGDFIDECIIRGELDEEAYCGNEYLGTDMDDPAYAPYTIVREDSYLTLYYRASVGTYKVGLSVGGATSGGGADITLLDEIDFEEKKDNEVYNSKAINDALMVFNEILTTLDERLGAIEGDYHQAFSLIGGAE